MIQLKTKSKTEPSKINQSKMKQGSNLKKDRNK